MIITRQIIYWSSPDRSSIDHHQTDHLLIITRQIICKSSSERSSIDHHQTDHLLIITRQIICKSSPDRSSVNHPQKDHLLIITKQIISTTLSSHLHIHSPRLMQASSLWFVFTAAVKQSSHSSQCYILLIKQTSAWQVFSAQLRPIIAGLWVWRARPLSVFTLTFIALLLGYSESLKHCEVIMRQFFALLYIWMNTKLVGDYLTPDAWCPLISSPIGGPFKDGRWKYFWASHDIYAGSVRKICGGVYCTLATSCGCRTNRKAFLKKIEDFMILKKKWIFCVSTKQFTPAGVKNITYGSPLAGVKYV